MSSWELLACLRSGGTGSVCLPSSPSRGLSHMSLRVVSPCGLSSMIAGLLLWRFRDPKSLKSEAAKPYSAWEEANQSRSPQSAGPLRVSSGERPPQRGWLVLTGLVLLRMEKECMVGSLGGCLLRKWSSRWTIGSDWDLEKSLTAGVAVTELTSCIPRATQGTSSFKFPHLTQRPGCHHYCHFTDEETGALRREVTWPSLRGS